MILSMIRFFVALLRPEKSWAPAIEIPDGECAAALGIYTRA